ncbi:MAG: triose-phosphate isomerase [Alphaproteobacteria bacterium]|nr:triose-phosphate isomerase [Alphaproteobacteria bacterium]
MKKLIAGNWKMNGDMAGAVKLASGIVEAIQDKPQLLERNNFLVCPPYVHLVPVQAELSVAVSLGAQDCSPFENGAYTGDISAGMLKNMNCEYVILGHSERRSYYAESNLLVKQKASMAHASGLKTIICVGETLEEREEGRAEEVVATQLLESLPDSATADNLVIAYEPVWAIGTGKTASAEDIGQMHQHIYFKLSGKLEKAGEICILYGGSVKSSNAKEIFAVNYVHGALIGGASLTVEDFIGIAEA